ncbi:type III secretion system effector XopF1 [Xanthomonas translucens]|uniref:type III secretion system effector XopF1 n=1 Tax=Xanthomonas campestris pv. translucens TaxID=343 RepID=UPI0027120346|nr:type III secretion system effector XopF1 [Xanthomonas translucens]
MKLTRQNSAPASIPSASSGHANAVHQSDGFVPATQPSRPAPLEGLSPPSARLRSGARAKTNANPTGGEASSTEMRQRHPEFGESSHAASQRADSSRRAGQPRGGQQMVIPSAEPGSSAERRSATTDRLKAQLRADLKKRPFAEPSKEQEELQARYLQWADARLQERADAFGPDAAYEVAGDMKALGKKASLPIAYECLRSFLVGALRTPLGISAAAAYQSSHAPASEPVSTAMLAGVISGMGSYTCDTLLLPSMDRRARVANLPRFQAVDPKILVPDPPPVLLEIASDGSKRFMRPGENGTPTRADLTAQAYDLRAGISQRQSTLDDTALDTMLFRPSISGVFNAARRTSGDPATRTAAAEVGLSALAIGGAGALHKALLDAAKVMGRTGQVTVPDLFGGHQRLNLFALALPDKTRPPATWSDAVHFPDYVLQTGKEAMALAGQAFSTANAATTALRDVLGRHMVGNVLSNIASLGASRLIASTLRGGYGGGSLPGEADNSPAWMLQQGTQMFFNDLVWNAFKAKNGTNATQATRLDQERAIAVAEQDRTISCTPQDIAKILDTTIALLSPPVEADVARSMEEGAGVPVPLSPGAGPLRDDLQQLKDQKSTPSVLLAAVENALDRLAMLQEASDGERLLDPALTAELIAQLQTVKTAYADKEQLRQWQHGRS